jgi:hypothetical protein
MGGISCPKTWSIKTKAKINNIFFMILIDFKPKVI